MREFYGTMSEQKSRRAGIHTCTASEETAEQVRLGYMVFKLGIKLWRGGAGLGVWFANTNILDKKLHADHVKLVPNGLVSEVNDGYPLAILPGLNFVR
jgi:hypothetical protein